VANNSSHRPMDRHSAYGVLGIIVAAILVGATSGCIEPPWNGSWDEPFEPFKPLPDSFESRNPAGTYPPEMHSGYTARSSPGALSQGGEPGLYSYIEKLTITRYNRLPTQEEYESHSGHVPDPSWFGKQFLVGVPVGTPLYAAQWTDASGLEWLMWSNEPFIWEKK